MDKLKCVICDIDGTIANGEHRQHYVRTRPKNWNAYDKLMHLDSPIYPVIDIINALATSGISIILCSGRKDKNRKETVEWLARHGVIYSELCMRPSDDHSDDCIIKARMYDKIKETYHVMAVFDDRPKVRRMWVDLGLFVFNVQQQEDEF